MDKKSKKHLTNEDIASKFKSNFELVNYAIRLAENMIRTGREPVVKSDIQNRAMLILMEIQSGEARFYDVNEAAALAGKKSADNAVPMPLIYEEKIEKKKFAEVLEGDE